MGTEIDIRRVTKYPPECFLSAMPVDLIAESNKVAEYVGFEPYILSLQGLSFARVDGLTFHVDSDGYTDVIVLDNLASAKGLDYEESVKVAFSRRATMRIVAPAAQTAYQWRHRITVFKPTVALKMLLGLDLKGRERELAAMYGLEQMLKVSTPEPFNIYSGIEEWKTVMAKLSASGTILRVPVPTGKKIILAGVSATRPASAGAAYLTVDRDDVTSVLNLDLYCLPDLSYEAPLRIVALEELEVSLDVRTAGDYYVRLVYGVGRLTLKEKVMWTPAELTSEERAEAEAKDLFNKVEAGVY
jgi:hypothetical protein